MFTPSIKGISVVLHVKERTGVDEFNNPVYSTTFAQVDNVVVSPVSSEDYTSIVNLTGKRASYTLCIPKYDQHNWENTIVEFFGEKWRTIGVCKVYMNHLVPLDWNKQINVERYE